MKNVKLATGLFIAVLLGTFAIEAQAQLRPGRVINIIVPVPPGGANDQLARLLGAKLQESLDQPVVILNKPGADQIIGTDFVAKAPADGHTLLLTGTSAMAVNPALNPKLPYDPLKDFTAVGMLCAAQMMLLVNPAVPVNSVPDLISYAKANPSLLNYGSGTSSFRFAIEMFKQMTGAPMTHIPYTGGARANVALLAGEVQVSIIDAATAVPHVKAGKLKALAAIPEVTSMPTLQSLTKSVPGYEMTIWFGLFAPKGTSRDIVDKLNSEMVRIIALPDIREKMLALGLVPTTGSPDQMTNRIERDLSSFRSLAKAADIK